MTKRTVKDGALTSADTALVFRTSTDLEAAAHGGESYNARDCAHCRVMVSALTEWFAAHAVGPEDEPA